MALQESLLELAATRMCEHLRLSPDMFVSTRKGMREGGGGVEGFEGWRGGVEGESSWNSPSSKENKKRQRLAQV